MSNFPFSLPHNLQRIILTGFMGAGKSTIGKLLAQRSGWEFLDLDTCVKTCIPLCCTG